MKNFKIFIDLTRLNKPIGYMLLFWPCSWGLAYSQMDGHSSDLFFTYLLLFFLGSVLMRSAGCIVNDIVDKDYDIKVSRTKHRPIASGKITVKKSLVYVCILCFLAFLILVQFNLLTIALGLASMILAFSYPYMKRLTYWPQLFLGLTFNWGIVMAWAAASNTVTAEILILYLSAIFWTLGYDTIYGVQDMTDDEIIGLKSTSIKFKKNIKIFVGGSYFISILVLTLLFREKLGANLITLLLACFALTLVYQVKMFNKKNPKDCLNAFKLNNFSGLLLFLGIYSI